MKKLISMIVAAMMLSISAHAATTYDVDGKSVTTDNSNSYKTVLISKGEAIPTSSDAIVYVDQADADNTFEAGTEFLLKEDVSEGLYTVRFGGDSTDKSTFYVGLDKAVGDIAMTAVAGGIEAVDGGYGVGYTVTAPGTYKSLLIKKGDTVLGCALDTVVTTNGEVAYGVQINAETKAELEAIDAVYLSARTIGEDVVLEEVQQ